MSIASKNLFELLGNDPELDPDRAPEPPTKAIDKPTARTGKRNGPSEAPARSAGNTTSRAPKDSGNANDNYIRDRGVGSDKNRSRGSGEPGEYRGGRGGRGRGRGGRGRGGDRDDRHSKTGLGEHEKQAAHGWGGNDGNAELADEQAGDAIAKQDEKAAVNEDAEAEADPEPEDKTKSYDAYLAELAEKKLALSTNVRKPNEGSSKKFPEGTAFARDEEEDFIAGSGGKAKRQRDRKEKAFVELDGDRMLAAPPREGGNSRGGRGGRGRGEGRGEFRGRGRGRGEGRGEGRGDARPRGGRGGQSGPNLSDSSAFPSLGS
ncbi:unnamed protein product [Periconia digitata]|uniref:Hyaluronan/mRNA-binding protein domain-containing protein n=1 Tax=Periconia digitata TaxID=1303443 RepID=A0A9W4XIP1_9PLEO|nr:unnamed protein product [Periconia digitata]